MENYYENLDELFLLYQEAKKYALEKAKQFDQQKAKTITYSTPSLLLGLHTPSLLLDIGYSKSFKKGRKLSSPKDRQDYLSYEYDESGKLFKITDYGDGLKFFYCIFEQNDFQWAVPIYKSDDQYYLYPYYTKISKWDDAARISIFAQINNSEIWIEKYTYDVEFTSKVICEKWNYIPNLSHSSKTKTISETGSPAELWIYRLDITNPKKIIGKMIEAYEHDVSAYRQKPPILPPPQIHIKGDN